MLQMPHPYPTLPVLSPRPTSYEPGPVGTLEHTSQQLIISTVLCEEEQAA